MEPIDVTQPVPTRIQLYLTAVEELRSSVDPAYLLEYDGTTDITADISPDVLVGVFYVLGLLSGYIDDDILDDVTVDYDIDIVLSKLLGEQVSTTLPYAVTSTLHLQPDISHTIYVSDPVALLQGVDLAWQLVGVDYEQIYTPQVEDTRTRRRYNTGY